MNSKFQRQLQLYRQALEEGRLLNAADVAMTLNKESNGEIVDPVAESFSIKGFYLAIRGKPKSAVNCFRQALWVDPANRYAADGLAMALEDRFHFLEETPVKGRIIIGMGTGRSGSASLTRLLRKQKDSSFAHEYPPRMGWDKQPQRLDTHFRRFNILRRYNAFVGDVSHWWLPHVEEVLELHEDVRFVAMQRNKEKTIESFLSIKWFKGVDAPGAVNHWVDHDGTFFKENAWDDAYPKYDVSDLPTALGMYWEDYYGTCEELQKKYPDTFRIFRTEELGDRKYQSRILQFCGFDGGVTIPNLQLNKSGSIDDGAEMN